MSHFFSSHFYNFLRVADRAKQIKTTAVVNESATDKLIRELKEENDKLKKMMVGGGGVGLAADASDSGNILLGISVTTSTVYLMPVNLVCLKNYSQEEVGRRAEGADEPSCVQRRFFA